MARRKGVKAVTKTDLPAAVQAGGMSIPIIITSMEEAAEEEAQTFGEFVVFENYIKINRKASVETARNVVIHEWLHAVMHLSGVQALLENHPGVEESIVRAVTTAVIPYISCEDLAAGRKVEKQ